MNIKRARLMAGQRHKSHMKRLAGTLAMLCLTTMGTFAQSLKYDSVPGDLMHTRIYTLDNGLKIYLSKNTEKPRIQTYIAVRTGSRNDPKETTGLAHYLEHLMFKGTTHFGTSNMQAERPLLDSIEHRFEVYRTLTDAAQRKAYYHQIDSISQLAARYNIPNEYDKMMSAIGADGSNAYTSNDVTCYEEDIPSNEVDNWARIQGDRFQNMVIRGFHTELEAVYEEFNINMASDGYKTYTALLKKLFPTHPYGTQSTIGLQEHLKNPSITNIKKYFAKYYVPNNVAICMAGDLDYDKTVATLQKYFGSWKGYGKVSAPEYQPQPVLTTPQDTSVVGQNNEALMMGWRFERGNALQMDTLDIINQLLCNGKAGLFDADLNQKMKVQSIDDGLEKMHDYSFFYIAATPKQGQTLDDVRKLVLAEIDKLKRGDFADDLVPAIINNYKRQYYESLNSNESRANAFVNAFILQCPWQQNVGLINRMSKITKQDIVNFAKRNFTDGYACVYKLQGNDTTIRKVDKPAITPIPTNNDKHSAFLDEIVSAKVEPIQPVFVNYQRDLTKSDTRKKLPVLYKQNTSDGLFHLQFHLPFGTESNRMLPVAAGFLSYLGTNKMTVEQVNRQFYNLACDFNIDVENDETNINLTGLSENMPKALALLTQLMNDAKPDKEAWQRYVDAVEKARQDEKTSQEENFSALLSLGVYGEHNPYLERPSVSTLKNMQPEQLTQLIKQLGNYQATVLYYGPYTLKALDNLVSKAVKTPSKFMDVPAGKPYLTQETNQNEVLLANYEAPNMYIYKMNDDGKKFDKNDLPYIAMFNSYFAGGMNSIIFQEMREARGLAYSTWARYNLARNLQDTYEFHAGVICQTDKMTDCLKELAVLMDSMPQNQAAFDIAKQSLEKFIASSRTTKFNVLSSYISAQKLGLNESANQIIYKVLPSLKLSDVVRFAQDNIAKKPYRYLILANKKLVDLKSLEKIAPVKKLSQADIFGK